MRVIVMHSVRQIRFGDSREGYIDDEKALRVLVPFVPPIVPMIDIEEGILHLTPPGGLLDLAEVCIFVCACVGER